MIELSVLSVFAAALVFCIGYDISILMALIFGFFLFFGYGLYKKHSVRQMAAMAFSGVKTVRNILITFVLIGIITAVWRACGTIPYIVYHATEVCSPDIMVLITFLLCCLISSLIGIIPALLGRIPLLGPAVTAAVAAVFWLISMVVEFLAHAALVLGMLPLTADGIAGRAQAERALTILRGNRENILYELALVLVMWVAVHGVYALMFLISPLSGALICDLFRAGMTAVSMAAISVIYLKERDRQDGMRYHA